MAELTPMKQQYQQIKASCPDCLLFFRLGDFYEMFDDDAKTASRELDLTLTTRDRGKPQDEQTPMCGVPYHSCEAYIARLIAKGYKVAICEQLEDPAKAQGLVERGVIRVITPGTVTEGSMLEEGRSNYLSAVCLAGDRGGCAFCDVSTGEFCAADFDAEGAVHVMNELARFFPREVILSGEAAGERELSLFMQKLDALTETAEARFEPVSCEALVRRQFPDSPSPGPLALRAAGALLGYIIETQKFDIAHINTLDIFTGGRYMELDWSARRNLELTENLRTGEKRWSLLWALDKTRTPMGSRLLRSWVERPLLSPVAIKKRLSAVGELKADSVRRGELTEALREIGDIQRLIGRVSYGTANGRDLMSLAGYLAQLPRLKELTSGASSAYLREITLMDDLADLRAMIMRAICDEPPFSLREGGILRRGYSEEVDALRDLRDGGAETIAAIEARERERSGIKKLKIGYNKVFGYYIDVPRASAEQVPDDYIRKQTLVSNERFFTPELKELENRLMTAKDRLSELEYQYFSQLRDKLAAQVGRVQQTAESVAALDTLCSLAEAAARNNYTCPEVDLSGDIRIVEGRHPVVELTARDTLFVPNDTFLNLTTDRLAIITGPNMAGKSTYMRQTALIVLMAQMGSFVPAKSALIGVADRVFTRIGASDDLAGGQSTFMVEMTEMAEIFRAATSRSLLILDEIGRGTSTFDGMAIARAMMEHCADPRRLGARTMFATHYHELSALQGGLAGVKNYNITAKKQGGNLIFLRKIVPGAADDSYGIEVAKLAGVPERVIKQAKEYLAQLEAGKNQPAAAPRQAQGQVTLADMGAQEAAERLRAAAPDTMTPIEALNLIYELKRLV